MRKGSTAKLERPRRRRPADDDGLDVDVSRLRVVGRGVYSDKRIGLGSLRTSSDVTQVEMAERMGITQTQVSKIEAGQDHLVSTLRRYAEALGGHLEVAIVLEDRKYRIE